MDETVQLKSSNHLVIQLLTMLTDFSIDRGGTFTDIYAVVHKDGIVREKVLKLLS